MEGVEGGAGADRGEGGGGEGGDEGVLRSERGERVESVLAQRQRKGKEGKEATYRFLSTNTNDDLRVRILLVCCCKSKEEVPLVLDLLHVVASKAGVFSRRQAARRNQISKRIEGRKGRNETHSRWQLEQNAFTQSSSRGGLKSATRTRKRYVPGELSARAPEMLCGSGAETVERSVISAVEGRGSLASGE